MGLGCGLCGGGLDGMRWTGAGCGATGAVGCSLVWWCATGVVQGVVLLRGEALLCLALLRGVASRHVARWAGRCGVG